MLPAEAGTAALATTADRRHSVNDLLSLYQHLAIPHFQRGLVWDDGAVALLLESLYVGTPCGSVLLWSPSSPKLHGIPLGDSPEFLIIDGQQRIRSLQSVFGRGDLDQEGATLEEDGVVSGADEPRAGSVWCVNLARVPEFAGRFKADRFRLFGLHGDPMAQVPAGTDQRLREDRRALLPLKWFLEGISRPDQLRAECAGKPPAEAVEAVLGCPPVMKRLEELRTNPLFDVRILGADQSLKDVVSAYNRINSAGKRVEAEERAFATLVSATDRAETALKRFFEQTRSGGDASADHNSTLAERDDLLHREKENRFGFKLFMRVFAIGLSYHSNRSVGSSSFSFDSIDASSLEGRGDAIVGILETTVDVLTAVARLIREKLHCDDFRTLPDTSSLWPVFQCLVRFPHVVPDHADRVASVVLRLVLSDLTTKDLLDLVSRVNEAHSAEDALAVFDGGSLTHDRVAKRVKAGVEAAQSLTDRYALILYWVLRKRGARDFSYAANSCSIGTDASSGSEPPEPLLNDSARPEKQHLVPYALLKRLFGVTGARPGRHETHDIGNLTYISAFQNGFDGVASTPLNVAAEPANNRDAHFLHDPLVIATFVKVCDSMKQGGDSSDQAKAYYRRFCAVRKGAIADAVIAWDAEARDTVPVGTPDLIPPQVRLIAPTLEDRLRQLAYPLPVINALIDLSRAGLREAQGKDLAIRLSLKRRGKGQPQLLRIDLPLAGAQVRLKVADPEFQRQFSRHFPAIPAKLSKGALRCTLSTTSRADIAQAVAALEWVLPLTGAARESVQ